MNPYIHVHCSDGIVAMPAKWVKVYEQHDLRWTGERWESKEQVAFWTDNDYSFESNQFVPFDWQCFYLCD